MVTLIHFYNASLPDHKHNDGFCSISNVELFYIPACNLFYMYWWDILMKNSFRTCCCLARARMQMYLLADYWFGVLKLITSVFWRLGYFLEFQVNCLQCSSLVIRITVQVLNTCISPTSFSFRPPVDHWLETKPLPKINTTERIQREEKKNSIFWMI